MKVHDECTMKSVRLQEEEDTDSIEEEKRVTTVEEPEQEIYTPWMSVYTCGICAFIQSAQFSIFFSSMWPYLKRLYPDATEQLYGLIMTLYSLAQCVAAPSFGYWSNSIEQVRLPLLIGFFCMTMGNGVYLLLEHVPTFLVPYVMMAGRFTVGAGTGNTALLRSYVGTASSKADRIRAIACVSGGIAVGTMLGPAFQLIFTPLGEEGISLGFMRFNIYTGPALFSMLTNFAGLMLIKFFFVESELEFEKKGAKGVGNKALPPDMIAICICIFTRFSQIYTQTTIETINSPYTMMMFDMNKAEAVKYNSSAHLVAGCLAATMYFFVIFYDLGKKLNDRLMCILSLLTMSLMFIVTYSYSFYPNYVPTKINGSDIGCDIERFDWCATLTIISPWLYYTFYILVFGLAFSMLNMTLSTLYTNIIGPRRQGTHHGVFQMAASIAKMTAPLITSHMYGLWGPKAVWSMDSGETGLTILVWLIFITRMVPFEQKIGAKQRRKTSA